MKNIIITGSNSGIGKEAALYLAKAGHTIIMLCRDSEKSKQAHQEIISQSGNDQLFLFPVDLADPSAIRNAVEKVQAQFPTIAMLVNNAGLYKTKRSETANGVEMSFAVNFLAPYMLSQLLLENIEASGNGRIINVVSELYKNGSINFDDLMITQKYKAGDAYANSKLATVLYTNQLAKETKATGITVNALHPGVLATDAFRDYPKFLVKMLNLFLEDPKKGGDRIAYLATSDKVDSISGKYFYKSEERELVIPDQEKGKTEKLLQTANELTGV